MADEHKQWLESLKDHFKSKPKAAKEPSAPPPPKGGPFGQARVSIGPAAPVLKQAEKAAKGWYKRGSK